MKKLKILVFDDNENHRKAAVAQLGKKHNLEVVGTYREAEKALENLDGKTKLFDAVLTDLLVPPSDRSQTTPTHAGQEMPIGVFIGLAAAVNAGAKHVVVFTDMNHHNHPASACLDPFGRTPFMVNGCKVVFSNSPNWMCEHKGQTVKNWAHALEYILKTPVKTGS